MPISTEAGVSPVLEKTNSGSLVYQSFVPFTFKAERKVSTNLLEKQSEEECIDSLSDKNIN